MKPIKPPARSLANICASKAALIGLLVGFGVFLSLEALRSILNLSDPNSLLTGGLLRTGRFYSLATGARSLEDDEDRRRKVLLSLWENLIDTGSTYAGLAEKFEGVQWNASIPRPPHLEHCSAKVAQYEMLDTRNEDGSRPSWSLWKGALRTFEPEDNPYNAEDQLETMLYNSTSTLHAPQPPWVEGADADNLPLTRRVQNDLWLHQHPRNCNDPRLKFILVNWDYRRNLGLGALINVVAGMFAFALRENRILVSQNFRRADHEGCAGPGRAQWDCYFLPETSIECRKQALYLASQPNAWKEGIITKNENYPDGDVWYGPTPGQWGTPWDYMPPTTEIDGRMLAHYKHKDRRWWRAQVVRYMMRYPTEYTCNLMNQARHNAFGVQAADMVLRHLPKSWPDQVIDTVEEGEIETFVWQNHKPWLPRPLVSVHVRLGDKASEMKMVGFKAYMDLAYRVRAHFPNAENIWLSTEMQEVIDESKVYRDWKFYYTNITRQTGTTSMEAYEVGLGQELSTNNAIVNFLMASDADFFIGALGSTWCYFIDGMRSAGGKDLVGYLSVNRDRYW